MKSLSSLLALAGLLAPIAASAQVTLSWDACSPHVGNADFVCTGPTNGFRDLYVSFRAPTMINGFNSVTVYLDIVDKSAAGGPLPTFWHLESGGCNATGVVQTNDPGVCTSFASPWGSGSTVMSSRSYVADFDSLGKGRLIVTFNETFPTLVLNPGQDYFLCRLRFANDNRSTCVGCSDQVGIRCSAVKFNDAAVTQLTTTTGLDIATVNCPGGPVFPDSDRDGYGHSDPASLCTPPCQAPISLACDGMIPAGWSARAGDCDDSNPVLHPTRTEVCNGIDDNCDGRIDEGFTETGLVGWWPGNGSTADATGGSNGSFVGSAVYAPGKVGNAFVLNGTSSYVSVPNTAALNPTNAITVMAWAKAIDGASRYIATKGEDSFYLGIGLTTFNKPQFSLNGVTSAWLVGTTSLNDNQWHHVAGTYDGTTVRIYVDGVQENSISRPGFHIACPGHMCYSNIRCYSEVGVGASDWASR